MNAYQQDNLETLYTELKGLEAEIHTVGRNLKFLGDTAAQSRADYELKKNQELILMFEEESKDKSLKRTESFRTAIYRTKYSEFRLKANLAEQNAKAEKDYLSALQSQLSGLQSRVKILELEKRISDRS